MASRTLLSQYKHSYQSTTFCHRFFSTCSNGSSSCIPNVRLNLNTTSVVNINEPRPISNYTKRLSIAPMVDVTDRYYRYMCRLLTKRTHLYTPMIIDQQIIHSSKQSIHNGHNSSDNIRHLQHNSLEHPLTVQMGGSQSSNLISAINECLQYGFRSVNLNVGCPADSAQHGDYGAKLMLDSANFAKQVKLVCKHFPSLDLSVKCRIGVNELDSFEHFQGFIELMQDAGIKHFIIHCRKALLNLDSHKNRVIPSINYSFAVRIKNLYPHLRIEINGDINSEEKIIQLLEYSDGVMMGRIARNNIYFLSNFDNLLTKFQLQQQLKQNLNGYPSVMPNQLQFSAPVTRLEVALDYLEFIQYELEHNNHYKNNMNSLIRLLINPMFTLYYEQSGQRQYRATLVEALQSGNMLKDPRSYILRALECVENFSGKLNNECTTENKQKNEILMTQ